MLGTSKSYVFLQDQFNIMIYALTNMLRMKKLHRRYRYKHRVEINRLFSDDFRFAHYSDVKWAPEHLSAPYSWLFVQADFKRKHHWLFVWGIHWSPVDSPHKRPGMRKVISFYDVTTVLVSAARRYNVSEAGKTHMQEGNAEGKKATLRSKKTTVLMALYGCHVTIVLIFVCVASYYVCSY